MTRAPLRATRSRIVLAHLIVIVSAIAVPLLVTAVQAPRSNVSLSYRLETAFWPLCLVSVLNLVCASLIGLPDLYRRFRTRVFASIGAPLVAASLSISLLVLFNSTTLPRSVFFATPIILAPMYLLSTAVANGGAFSQRRQILAVVGDSSEIMAIEDDLKSLQRLDLRVIDSGAFARDADQELTNLEPEILVLCRSSRENPGVVSTAERLHLSGTQVRRLVDFYEEWFGKLPLQELESTALFTDVAEIHAPIYLRAKRWIDVSAGLLMLVPLALVGAVVSIANRIASPGPVIFSQDRVGLNGQRFRIHKFRTMRPSDGSAGDWTAENDPRITNVGKFLRRTHLDELPQAINILRGELSMVGPRPEQVHYVEQLSKTIPFYELRHVVRPGLTGWAQVRYPYGADERDAIEKLQFELYYIRHQRLSLDVQVLAMTAGNMLTGAGK